MPACRLGGRNRPRAESTSLSLPGHTLQFKQQKQALRRQTHDQNILRRCFLVSERTGSG